MNKIILIFFIALGILFKINVYAHTDHYENIKSMLTLIIIKILNRLKWKYLKTINI